jgi:hypothetical protein
VELSINEIQEEELTSYGDYYSIALFRGSGGDVVGLEFQRCVGGIYGHPDSGDPPYCVVTADHDTQYGGVESVVWSGASAEVNFTSEARNVLKLTDERVVLHLDLRDQDIVRVKDGLRRVFGPGDFEYAQPELIGFE